MRLLRYPAFLSVSLSHLGVDVLNGQVGVLLAALSLTLGLSNAQIGLIATAYAILGSLTQPFFGWLSDRDGGRWTLAGGVLWMAAFFGLLALAPAGWALPFMLLGSLGSGAFHPPGTARAAQVGALGLAGQAATAASIFFLFGQVGLSAGPAVGGFLLEHVGRPGLFGPAALTFLLGLFTFWALPAGAGSPSRPAATGAHPAGARPLVVPALGLLVLILVISGLRVWAQSVITTFGPKFLQDLGLTSSEYGAVVGVFMAGTAIGGVLGSSLADRWSYPRTILLSQLLSLAPFVLFPLVRGPWLYLLAALAGLFNGGPHSILVTMAQRTLPGRAGFASGLILGLTFALGALGTSFTGWLADRTGLALALQLNAALAGLAALLSLGLVLRRSPAPAPAPTGD